MKWMIALCLPILGVAELVAAEADATKCPPSPVLFHVKVLELDQQKLRSLGFDYSKIVGANSIETCIADGPAGSISLGNTEIFEALIEDKLASVIAEPVLVVVLGRSADFHVGGEVMLWRLGPDGKPIQFPKRYGTSANLDTKQIDKDTLRLEMRLEISEVDKKHCTIVGGKKNPGIRVRAVTTGMEIRWGQTVIVKFPESKSLGQNNKTVDSKSTIVLVTAEPVAALETASSSMSVR